MPIVLRLSFALFVQCISLHKKVDLFSSVFKKIIHNATNPTFKDAGGNSIPHILSKA